MPLRVEVQKIVLVVCDFCGKKTGEGNFPWSTVYLAREGAKEEGWTTVKGASCCPGCKEKAKAH